MAIVTFTKTTTCTCMFDKDKKENSKHLLILAKSEF